MNPTPADAEIDLILGLFQRDIERHYGGRTVGETLNGEEAKRHLQSLLDAARKDQSRLTSKWIEQHIEILRPLMHGETSGVVLTYAADQARQGSYEALSHPAPATKSDKE